MFLEGVSEIEMKFQIVIEMISPILPSAPAPDPLSVH